MYCRSPHANNGDELCADALALEFLDGELAQAAGNSGVLAAAHREEKSGSAAADEIVAQKCDPRLNLFAGSISG